MRVVVYEEGGEVCKAPRLKDELVLKEGVQFSVCLADDFSVGLYATVEEEVDEFKLDFILSPSHLKGFSIDLYSFLQAGWRSFDDTVNIVKDASSQILATCGHLEFEVEEEEAPLGLATADQTHDLDWVTEVRMSFTFRSAQGDPLGGSVILTGEHIRKYFDRRTVR